ncbi:Ser-Thr-rich glycosyl-phosphatidyl-inositol-anchored membrane family-domain-containing protein [Rhexocercosporidium sp. MPI-PUGE-AT-0058]|nr:Ser-Thr-rich glycosyl-phosphatidyl-inositol-anchored membrane family-domain-containing protein [Rhexocercosporidium sp. MPI-PUGE-AT-0058]
MQFSFALVAAAACAVANAVSFTNGPASFVGITAGKALNISWADASGPVTLTLKTGEANALTTVSTIASGLTGTSYAWAIPATLPESTYALEIGDSTGVPNYSVRFQITGGPASSSSASGSTTSTASSASTTGASNSTITSSSRSSTGTASTTSSGSASRTATTSSGTSTASAPPNANSGASFASPLAFVLLAFAALMTLN